MSLSKICINRPVFASVLNLVIVTLGLIFFNKLTIRSMPGSDAAVINVFTYYKGADALYMAKEVTAAIEQRLKTVKNLDSMTSSSKIEYSDITLKFKLSADIEVALNDVRAKILNFKLLEGMRQFIDKFNPDDRPSLWLSVSSDQYDELGLTKFSQDNIVSGLERLEAVGKVVLFGAKQYSIRIEPDPVKMFEHQISPTELEQAIRQQNTDYPAGRIKTTARNFIVGLDCTLSTAEEFANIIIKNNHGKILKLKDLAKVHLGAEENHTILRYNAKRSLGLGIVKQSQANILDLSKQVKAALKKINQTLPASVKIAICNDAAVPINASIQAVFVTIFEAIILVALVTYLFLASAKMMIIPLVTIPISLISTFTMMYFCGFSINTFTLLAMILAIGLVVDDSMIVLENIFRHCRALGQSPKQSAISASEEISFAIIAMTIVLSAVFVPIGLIDGVIGQLLIEFAWTLAFCVLFSGFVSLTLTPVMASYMITENTAPPKRFLAKFNQYIGFVQVKYADCLKIALDRKKLFMLFVSPSIIILAASLAWIDKVYMPQEDQGVLYVSFKGPAGFSQQQSEKIVIEAEKILASHSDILGFLEFISFSDSNKASGFVLLKARHLRSKSQEQIKNQLNRQLASITGMSVNVSSGGFNYSGSSGAVEFNLQTTLEHWQLDQISQEFLDELKALAMFYNPRRTLKSSTPILDVAVNRDKAALYGVSLVDIGQTIQYLIAGQPVGKFKIDNESYDVILQYNLADRNQVGDLRKILVKNTLPPSKTIKSMPDSSEIMVPLEMIASINEKITVNSYTHYNNRRSIGFSAYMLPGYRITDAIKAINQIAERLIDARSTKLEYLGDIKQLQESTSNMLSTGLFALIFIYLVLSAQFESFTDPLIILLAVPFAITGGVLTLLIFDNSLNLYSNIGLITLMGLVTKNSIMIVEFANQLKSQGLTVRAAVTKAASLRLRPILMTTLATIFGAVPLALASGAGSASRNSIGLVIIGGMLVGTIFTIFVIPVLYQTFKRS